MSDAAIDVLIRLEVLQSYWGRFDLNIKRILSSFRKLIILYITYHYVTIDLLLNKKLHGLNVPERLFDANENKMLKKRKETRQIVCFVCVLFYVVGFCFSVCLAFDVRFLLMCSHRVSVIEAVLFLFVACISPFLFFFFFFVVVFFRCLMWVVLRDCGLIGYLHLPCKQKQLNQY